MKRIALILSIAFAMTIGAAGAAFAAPGGLPGVHGVYGMEFGQAVAALAQSAPGAVSGHINGD